MALRDGRAVRRGVLTADRRVYLAHNDDEIPNCRNVPSCAHWAWKYWERCDACPWQREGSS